MAARPKRLIFTGEFDGQGKPLRYFLNVPARDLEPADLDKLSDERIAEIQLPPFRLYVDPEAKGDKATSERNVASA